MNAAQEHDNYEDQTGSADDFNLIAPVEGWQIEDFSDLLD